MKHPSLFAVLSLATILAGTAISSTAQAGCENKDRPATPTDLTITHGVAAGTFTLFWTNHQTRTGLTYFDIHVRGPKNQDLHKDIGGGAGQAIRNGGVGQFKFTNVPAVSEYTISMRARTKAGTEGCVSGAESVALHFKGPIGGSAPPKGLPGNFPGNVGR